MLVNVVWGLSARVEQSGKAPISPCEFSGWESPGMPLLLQGAGSTCRKVFPGLVVIHGLDVEAA